MFPGMDRPSSPRINTIPSADAGFRRHVERVRRDRSLTAPTELEDQLRRLFPRVIVRERVLSGESPTWYVYRDGGWQPSLVGPWWEATGLPRIGMSAGGWITEANPTARSLLGIEPADIGGRHLTDFVAPGTLDESVALFAVVEQGNDLTATILLRPSSGDVVAIDIHAWRDGSTVVVVLRLAEGVEVSHDTAVVTPGLTCLPEADAAFAGYARMALSRMPEPTPDGLALRLRRLYPHARVTSTGDAWVAVRDHEEPSTADTGWWLDATLPRVRYDAQALIIEANAAAEAMLGSTLVGHYWQEFVTPGSTEQVSAMLAILAAVGAAESRFRMPGANGALVEFDSYTEVDGETFTTVIRPRE